MLYFITISLVVCKRWMRVDKTNTLHYVECCVDYSSTDYKVGNIINLIHYISVMNTFSLNCIRCSSVKLLDSKYILVKNDNKNYLSFNSNSI